MSLTNGQKQALHAAARQAGVVDDELRRAIQRRIGGFHSAADRGATRRGFIAVMAFYEGLLAKRGEVLGSTPGYWRDEDRRANPTDALVHLCRQLAAALGWDAARLDEFLAGPHMSGGACDDVATAPAYWLRRAVEALKAMAGRRSRAGRVRSAALLMLVAGGCAVAVAVTLPHGAGEPRRRDAAVAGTPPAPSRLFNRQSAIVNRESRGAAGARGGSPSFSPAVPAASSGAGGPPLPRPAAARLLAPRREPLNRRRHVGISDQ